MLNFGNKEFRNLQEQVLENAKDIEILKEKPNLSISIVDELPETGEEGILYLVPKDPDPDTGDADSYDEYVWLPEEETFELVGNTAIDLSNMVTTDTNQTISGAKSFNAIANFNSGLKASAIEVDGETTMKATADSTANIWKFRPVNDYNLYVARDGSDRFLFQSNMFAPATYQSPSINLGSANYKWNAIWGNEINFGDNATITKDSSNRINLNTGGTTRIKVGTATSTYCNANWTPDQSATYNLGSDGLRWNNIYLNDKVYAYESYVTYFNSTSGSIYLKCNFAPNTHNGADLGTSSRMWKDLYIVGELKDGTNSVAVADIVKQPDYDNPDLFTYGTLDSSGQSTIDMTNTGVPSDGLYMFTYGNCQCFIALTSTMIQNASTSPIRCPCPTMYNGSAYPGILKIERSSDLLTLTVATAGVGNVQPSGFQWQLIKVF